MPTEGHPSEAPWTEPATPARWSLGTWIRQGLAALFVLFVAVLALWLFGEERWHAELSFDDYACDDAGICPMRPKISRRSADGTGHIYRFTTNSAGFRGVDWPAPGSHPDTFRIAVLGSSPVFGLGVENAETLPVQLQRRLAELMPERKVEVLNFGLPENYLASQLVTYARFVRPLEPDLVVFVQPDLVHTRDMNERLLQLHRSSLLKRLLKTPWGGVIVNRWQYLTLALGQRWRGDEAGLVRDRFGPVLEDQRSRGLRVLMFNYAGSFSPDARALPSGLAYDVFTTGLDPEQYRSSGLAIPGDGHPNAAGHAKFAAQLAEHLSPLLSQP